MLLSMGSMWGWSHYVAISIQACSMTVHKKKLFIESGCWEFRDTCSIVRMEDYGILGSQQIGIIFISPVWDGKVVLSCLTNPSPPGNTVSINGCKWSATRPVHIISFKEEIKWNKSHNWLLQLLQPEQPMHIILEQEHICPQLPSAFWRLLPSVVLILVN